MAATPVNPTPLVVTTLVFLIATTAFAIDISLPALPVMSEATGATLEMAQRTIGVFILGYALGQIPMGLLADRFGRRPVLISGMSGFVVFGVATAITNDIETLITLRFFQGIGAATGAVLSRAVARDITDGAQTARLLTFLASSMGFAMVAAPILGTVFLAWLGWRGPFIGSALWGGLGLVLSVFVLHETRKASAVQSTFGALRAGFEAFLKFREAWFGAALAGLSFCGVMSLVTLSPAVMMVEQGLSSQKFAGVFVFISTGYITGSLILRKYTSRFSVRQLLIRTAFCFGVCGSAALVAAGLGQLWFSIAVLVPMLGLLGANLGLANALALQPMGQVAGVAAGIVGTLQLLIGGSYSIVSTFVGIDSLAVLMAAFAVISALIIAVTWLMARSDLNRQAR